MTYVNVAMHVTSLQAPQAQASRISVQSQEVSVSIIVHGVLFNAGVLWSLLLVYMCMHAD